MGIPHQCVRYVMALIFRQHHYVHIICQNLNGKEELRYIRKKRGQLLLLVEFGSCKMNSPMKDRRAALDLAIQALDEMRRKYAWGTMAAQANIAGAGKAKEKLDAINKAIQTLTRMREEGPLL